MEDDHPLMFFPALAYWAFLVFFGFVWPASYVATWLGYTGLVPPQRLHVESAAMVWLIPPIVIFSAFTAAGVAWFVRPIAAALQIGFVYGLLLPGLFAACVTVVLDLVGLHSKRLAAFVHLGFIAVWLCYGAYLLVAPYFPRRRSAPGDVPTPLPDATTA